MFHTQIEIRKEEKIEDSVRGKNQKKKTMWSHVHALSHKTQAENLDELNRRNIESMKGRFKRLNENVGKWVAALEEANRRKRSGMSQKDIEMEAHTIYEIGGSKFQELVVYNDVMNKHPRWAASSHNDTTWLHPDIEMGDDEESGGNTKRSRTSKDGEYHMPSNQETPTNKGSTMSHPTGRDKSKKIGKGKATQSGSKVAAELRALRLTRESENELFAKKLELESQKLRMNHLKMEKRMLNTLLARDHLSPEDEETKCRLLALVFGQN
ncbi:hypothetical protein C2S51_018190 [Perilla frutescens var. frutescens]|nr:hypothetical protein C2S51_018190 [Perilla frutescens var. frutescens]